MFKHGLYIEKDRPEHFPFHLPAQFRSTLVSPSDLLPPAQIPSAWTVDSRLLAPRVQAFVELIAF